MPRSSRLDAPGILHHVIIRGIERRKIFKDDIDWGNFIGRVETLLPETHTFCYAWALLTNHAHFLFRTGGVPLATVMRRLLTGHAVSFNRRHKRHGKLFQNRYKSIICQEDVYLKELVRYIHLNPLRAKIVSTLSELKAYPYCGHGKLMGQKVNPWQDEKYVLAFFGKTVKKAQKAYKQYMEKGLVKGRRPELVGGGLVRSLGGWDEVKKIRLQGQDRIKSDQRILGDSDFVTDILAQAEERFNRFYELKNKGYDLRYIEQRVCGIFNIEPDELYSRSREKIRAMARGVFCYWAVRELGNSLTDIASRFEMTVSGVGYAVKRGEQSIKEHGYTLTG